MARTGLQLLTDAYCGNIEEGARFTDGKEIIERVESWFMKVESEKGIEWFRDLVWTDKRLDTDWYKVEQRPELDEWDRETLTKAKEYGYTHVKNTGSIVWLTVKNGVNEFGSSALMFGLCSLRNKKDEGKYISIAWLLGEEE